MRPHRQHELYLQAHLRLLGTKGSGGRGSSPGLYWMREPGTHGSSRGILCRMTPLGSHFLPLRSPQRPGCCCWSPSCCPSLRPVQVISLRAAEVPRARGVWLFMALNSCSLHPPWGLRSTAAWKPSTAPSPEHPCALPTPTSFKALAGRLPGHIYFYLFDCSRSSLQPAGSLAVDLQALSCGMWDLVPCPGIEPWAPCLASV